MNRLNVSNLNICKFVCQRHFTESLSESTYALALRWSTVGKREFLTALIHRSSLELGDLAAGMAFI